MPAIELLVRMLSRRDALSEAERQRIHALQFREKLFAKGESIVVSHTEPQESCLLLSGIAGREIILEDGGRQITALQVAGDFVDLHGLVLKRMDHGVLALTDCQVANVAHGELIKLGEDMPHLMRLFWLSTLIDGAIQRNWTASMGRRNALSQLAHLLCELYLRLEVVGLARDGQMRLHLSQLVLADVLGLSAVHVNRTLQSLRRQGLIEWLGSDVTIRDFDKLAELSDFDQTYLNLIRLPR